MIKYHYNEAFCVRVCVCVLVASASCVCVVYCACNMVCNVGSGEYVQKLFNISSRALIEE